MQIDKIKNSTLSSKGFFPTLREQPQEKENPYALRDDLIKPLPPEGHLVHTTILNAPKHFFSGLAYDVKSLKKGFNGTANDHELGKLNSIGLVTGGAALAAYLTTRRQTASSKAMEFVGIASFLASMALWPVIAIQIPTKLIHGFNVRQHYKDSMDREKLFFNDSQYIPWDLYSEKQIYKIGDYMGVPRDMNNRRDYIQEKMKKIATQDNTLWMLSAGFAVPIMSALICNQAEQPVKNLCAHIRSEQNKKILQKALSAQYDVEDTDMYKRLNSFLELNNGKPLHDDLINQICEIVGYDSNSMVTDKFHAELRSKLSSNKAVLEPQDAQKVLKTLQKNLSDQFRGGQNSHIVSALMLNSEELGELLQNGEFINRELDKADFKELNKRIVKKVFEKMETYNASGIPEAEKIQKIDVLTALNNRTNAGSAVHKFRLTRPAIRLDEQTQKMLRTVAKELATMDYRGSIVKDFIYKELAAAEETKLANVANKMNEDIFKALNIPWKDMNAARNNRDLMAPVIRTSIDRIAADNTEFERVMKQLAQIAHSLDEFDGVVSPEGNKTFFEQTISRVLNPGARKLEEMGFTNTAYALAGSNADSEKSIMKAYAANRLMGMKSTIYRLISSLDMHRRVATMTNVGNILGEGLCREVKEEIVELSKRNTLTAHRSDFAVKFFFNGNPHPDYDDVSDIEVRKGKVVNKYYKAGRSSYKDVSADPTLYKETMNLMYGGDMHPASQGILGDKLLAKLQTFRKDCYNYFGDEWYFIRPESFMTPAKEVLESFPDHDGGVNYVKPKFRPSTNKFKFLMTGVSLDDMAMKYAQQKHNSKVWMKMFGGLGLGIFGLTVAAQFFFGKTPQPKEQVQA